MDIASILEGLSSHIKALDGWAYVIACAVASLETAGFMGFFFPGETWAVFIGFLSARGVLVLKYAILSMALGGLLGDNIGYWMGRRLGRGYFRRHERFLLIKRAHIQKMDGYFARHGGGTVFIGRFIALARSLTPFSAGLGKMDYGKFLAYDVATVIIWTFSFTLLGYFFGRNLRLIEIWSARAGIILLLLAALAVLAGYVSRRIGGWIDLASARLHRVLYGLPGAATVRGLIAAYPGIRSWWRRVTPEQYLAAHLLLGTALSLWFARLMGRLYGTAAGGGIWPRPGLFPAAIIYLRSPQATRIMIWAGYPGRMEAIAAGSLLLILYLYLRSRFAYLFTYAAAFAGSELIASRSGIVHGMLTLFHSSHITVVLVSYAMAAYILRRVLASRTLRVLAAWAAMFSFLTVCISRLYLSISEPMNMAFQIAAGLFYVLVCTYGLKVFRHKTKARAKH